MRLGRGLVAVLVLGAAVSVGAASPAGALNLGSAPSGGNVGYCNRTMQQRSGTTKWDMWWSCNYAPGYAPTQSVVQTDALGDRGAFKAYWWEGGQSNWWYEPRKPSQAGSCGAEAGSMVLQSLQRVQFHACKDTTTSMGWPAPASGQLVGYWATGNATAYNQNVGAYATFLVAPSSTPAGFPDYPPDYWEGGQGGSGGQTPTTPATTAPTSSGGSCGGAGQPACSTSMTDDDEGFFDGMFGGVTGAVTAMGSGIIDAVNSAVTAVISGITATLTDLFAPSAETVTALLDLWDQVTTKAPFSVLYEAVTFVPSALSSLAGGIGGGAPACEAGQPVCLSDAIAGIAAKPGVSAMKTAMLVVMAMGFVYGVYRSVGQVIG